MTPYQRETSATKSQESIRLTAPNCDCPAHRRASANHGSKLGGWSLLLPLLACAVCPACLATYAKVLSLLGVGVGMSESQHLLVLTLAVLVSVVVSALRSWRSKRWWPILFALSGAALILLGHVAPHLHELEWAGVLVLLVGGLSEHFKLRSSAGLRLPSVGRRRVRTQQHPGHLHPTIRQ